MTTPATPSSVKACTPPPSLSTDRIASTTDDNEATAVTGSGSGSIDVEGDTGINVVGVEQHDSACQPIAPTLATAVFESSEATAVPRATQSDNEGMPNAVDVTTFTSRFGSAFHNEAVDVGTSNTVTIDDMNGQHYTLSLPNQGHSCCYCCCDMRRAVFIVDAFYVVYALYIVLMRRSNDIDICYRSSYIIGECDWYGLPLMEYDEKSSGGKVLSLDLLLLLTAFRILSAASGMVGAVCFQPGLVALAMLPHFVDVYFVLFMFDYFEWLAPLSLLFVYPHVYFIKEALREKTMTRARYQPHGCCPSPW